MPASTSVRVFEFEQTCSTCAANVSMGNNNLCSECEKYVSQDHVAQRELQLHERALQAFAIQPEAARKQSVELLGQTSTFEMLLAQAELSPRQKDVIRLRFVENLSFFSISKKLGISRMSTHRLYRKGLKRLKRGVTNVRIVRGHDPKPAFMPEKGSFQKAQVPVKGPELCPVKILRPDAHGVLQLVQVIEPNKLSIAPQPQGRRSHPRDHYPKNCPRCSGVLLRPRGQAPYCADCLWVPEFHE